MDKKVKLASSCGNCPRAAEEAHILLIEPAGIRNTGDAVGTTAADEKWI